jgi:hypothetical protein
MDSPRQSGSADNGPARFGAKLQLKRHAIMLIGWKQRLRMNYPTGLETANRAVRPEKRWFLLIFNDLKSYSDIWLEFSHNKVGLHRRVLTFFTVI